MMIVMELHERGTDWRARQEAERQARIDEADLRERHRDPMRHEFEGWPPLDPNYVYQGEATAGGDPTFCMWCGHIEQEHAVA